MAENKTKQTDASVAAFLDGVEPAQRRDDARAVCAMMARISGHPPAMWGPSIVGFGRYHYRYDSGHEGDWARTGFSPRKTALTLYITGGFPRHADLMAKLGKYRTGKSCLYLNKLSDVDRDVLEALIEESLGYMKAAYPE